MLLAGFTIKKVIYAYDNTVVARAISPAQQTVIIKYQNTAHPSVDLDVRWQHEYQILRSIDCDYVVKALGLHRNHNSHILVLADFSSVTLSELISDNKLKFISRLQLACQLSKALIQVHNHQLIHRDIAPKNILVDPVSLKLKLCDFALASKLGRERSQIKNTHLWGTLGYISPELTGRTNLEVDYRSDFYALGITLFELFCGRKPFNHDDPLTLLHAHLARQPEALHHIDDSIPEVLAAIITKLLAKSPDQRYQSGYGLLADLNTCLQRWQEGGYIEPFAIAQSDIPEQFCLSQKLYGRDHELAQLIDAFARISANLEATDTGQAEWVLLSGCAGIGKSALVYELQQPVTAKRGFFMAGKCDQYNRNQPYSALIQAFSPLMLQLLNEGKKRVGYWQKTLKKALGNNVAVISDIIPELSLLIDSVPPLTPLPPAEAEIRFHLTFNQLLNALSSNGQPLVLFLDDLQWADISTLKLLEQQLGNAQHNNKALLIVGAYRDNEIKPGDPLAATLQNIEQQQKKPLKLHLSPLQHSHIEQLLSDSLRCDKHETTSLVDICIEKTRGNPFFLKRFLTSLYDNDDIRYEHKKGRWGWDIAAIKQHGISDNVAELMTKNLSRLDSKTVQLLSLAAHLGSHFTLWQLAIIAARDITRTAKNLWPALQAGLLIPLNEDYQFDRAPEKLARASYRFLHDRVQQAAHEQIDAQQRPQLQLRSARALLTHTSAEQQEALLFTIVTLFNHARELLVDDDEKALLLRLNLRSGIKAKKASAFDTAVGLLRIAKTLLPADSWHTDAQHTLSVVKELAEAEYLAGHFTEAEALYRQEITACDDVNAKTTLVLVQADQYQLQGRFDEAVTVLLRGLAYFDCQISDSEQQAETQVAQRFTACEKLLATKSRDELLHDKEMSGAAQLLQMRLHVALIGALYFTGRVNASALNACHIIELTLRHGQSDLGSMGFISYLGLMARMGESYPRCYQIGKLAVNLADRRPSTYFRNAVYQYFSSAYLHWCKPLRNAFHYLDKSRHWGDEGINLTYAGYACAARGMLKLIAGVNLIELETQIGQDIDFLHRTHQQASRSYTLICALQPVLALQGKTLSPLSFDSDEVAIADELNGDINTPSTALALLSGGMLRHAYLMEDQPLQRQFGANIALIDTFIPDTPLMVESQFYHALSLLEINDPKQPDFRQYQAQAVVYAGRFKRWSQGCHNNFYHKYLLLSAELARVDGDTEKAIGYYDKAIDAAAAAGFMQCEALAHERYAKFWLGRGQARLANALIKDAHYLYQHWGAYGKCQQLETHWAQAAFVLDKQPFEQYRHERTEMTLTSNRAMPGRQLDLHSLIKASQLLSQEIQLDILLDKMMGLLLENAGAQQGAIILNHEGQLEVVISGELDSTAGAIEGCPVSTELIGQSLSEVCAMEPPLLPEAIITRVQQSHNTELLNNPAQSQCFAHSSYLQQRRPKSVICSPIIGQGKLVGIVYLENNLTENAFTPDHQQMLDILGSQAAVSLINARLYNSLEEKVRQRTAELRALAMKDGLTGVANRRQFDETLDREWRRSLRKHYPLALLMIDIDKFKPYNDHYGHPQGDKCISAVAKALDQCVHRASDLVARYGGEEFTVLLPHSDAEQAGQIARRCLDAIRSLGIPHQHSDAAEYITVSIGIGISSAIADSEHKADSLLKLADQALYRAKANGRNQIAV